MKNHRYNQGMEEIRKATRLYDAEKSAIVTRLSKYVSENPPLSLKWPTFLVRREFVFALASIVILIAGGSATMVSAEKAVPGSFLYPIKISVTENLRGIPYATTAGKASLEAWKTGRRLAEAETLALSGKLTDGAELQIRELLVKSTASFAVLQNELVKQGLVKEAAAAQGEFDAEIGAHSRIVTNVKNHSSDKAGNSQIDGIVQVIRENVPAASATVQAAASVNVEKASTNSDFNQDTLKKAKVKTESLIEKARKTIDQNYGAASDIQKDILDDARATLNAAENSFKNSESEMEAGNNGKAEASLNASLQSLQEANITVKQSGKFKESVKVKENIESRGKGGSN